MRFLNWPHAIIGFLIGVALILYIRGDSTEKASGENQQEVVEVQVE